MLTINTNLSSLIAQSSMKESTNKLNQAIERMTTGFKINHAKDNAANHSIATNMTTKIGAYMVAEDNVLQGLDMINIVSESLSLIEDKLMRLRVLATQASNGTYGNQSKEAINAEANALVDEIERLYSTTEYNKLKLFNTNESSEMPKAGADGFIKQVDKVDTTNLDKLSEISDTTVLSSGTYSISTKDELEQLAQMTNNGLIGANCVFVLANDIDLSSCENWTPIGISSNKFTATFDGNGYKITNLKINNPTVNMQGLFGDARAATIKNLGIVNAKVIGNGAVGVLVGLGGIIQNCYSTGYVEGRFYTVGGLIGQLNISCEDSYSHCDVKSEITSGDKSQAGGLIGSTSNATYIRHCFATGDVNANGTSCGGLVGVLDCDISESYSTGNVTGFDNVGGFIGYLVKDTICSIDSCYLTGVVIHNGGIGNSSGFIGYINRNADTIEIKNSYMLGTLTNENSAIFAGRGDYQSSTFTIENCYYNPEGVLADSKLVTYNYDNIGEPANYLSDKVKTCSSDVPFSYTNSNFSMMLQVGINSDTNSKIAVEHGISLDYLNLFRNLINNSNSCLAKIDKAIQNINSRQTEYGAAQNRLESALEEIAIKYDNLVSSRSTIRDADIAEVSSHYIQQQILQQASATLLATANQSPSIALQLI